MAFKDVSESGKLFKLTSLEVGGSITGHVVGISNSSQGGYYLVMNLDGERVNVTATGNIKYLVKDEKIKLGCLTRITRLEDVKIKKMTSTKFKVEQDEEDMLAGFSANQSAAATSSSNASIQDKLASLKG